MEIKIAHHIPQIGEAGLRKRAAVVHVEHKRTLRAILFACKQRQERRGDWNIPPCRCRFQVAADDRLRVGENGVVPHMDYLRVEINIRPHETANLAAPHTGLEGNQTKEICPCSEYRIQKLS